MKSFICLIALAASFLSSTSAAPTPATELVERTASCSCNDNRVPNAIVVFADVVAKLDADINAKVYGAVDVSADVVAAINADLLVVAQSVDDCNKAMTAYVVANTDVSATVAVFANLLVKLDALLQVCADVEVDVSVKASINASIGLIKSKCGSLVSVLGRIFLGIKARLLLRINISALVCLRGIF